jgi:hypothetical protein
MIFGCVCDSSWPVGVGNGEYFVSEWFGADCSLRRCPSDYDRKYQLSNFTDCYNVLVPGSLTDTRGQEGALCHQECAGQGTCDYTTGDCKCYEGRWGRACEFYEGYEPPKVVYVDTVDDDTVIYLANLAASAGH